jgi:hypothetical protein
LFPFSQGKYVALGGDIIFSGYARENDTNWARWLLLFWFAFFSSAGVALSAGVPHSRNEFVCSKLAFC